MDSIVNIDQHKVFFQWNIIRLVLQVKHIHPLFNGHLVHYWKVNNPKTDKNQL